MNRRQFMRTMFGTAVTVAVGQIIPAPKYAWDKLHGIDWGLNDGTVGTWMGIKRSTEAMWKPYPIQETFMLKNIPVIPYSGIPRNTVLMLHKDLADILRKLQEDKGD